MRAVEFARRAVVNFVKTSTGYGRHCKGLMGIQLIKENVDIEIQAPRGIEDYTRVLL